MRAHVLFTLFVFLRIVMSNTYCVVFLLYLSSSCVPYVASFYYPFGILQRLFKLDRIKLH